MKAIGNLHLGSSFDDFLEEEGIRKEATMHAVKRVLAWQIKEAMKAEEITKVEMARRIGTSCAHLDRLLDPDNDKVHSRHRAARRRRRRPEAAP